MRLASWTVGISVCLLLHHAEGFQSIGTLITHSPVFSRSVDSVSSWRASSLRTQPSGDSGLSSRGSDRTGSSEWKCQSSTEDQSHSNARRSLLVAASCGVAATLFPSTSSADVQLQYGSGSFSGKSVVNGVLSAYGLPQLPDAKGYTPFLQQFKDTVVEFQYPSSWVVNNKARFAEKGLKAGSTGVTVSDYRTAEGLTLFSLPTSQSSVSEVTANDVADLVIDAGKSMGSKASGFKVVKQKDLEDGYKQYTFSWESITASGYEVERIGVAAATVRRGTLYAIFSVVGKPRAKAMGPVLDTVAQSFKVYKI